MFVNDLKSVNFTILSIIELPSLNFERIESYSLNGNGPSWLRETGHALRGIHPGYAGETSQMARPNLKSRDFTPDFFGLGPLE
jgi:hypothetical protein